MNKSKRLNAGVFSKSFFFKKSLNRLAFLYLKKKQAIFSSPVICSIPFFKKNRIRKKLSELLIQKFKNDIRIFKNSQKKQFSASNLTYKTRPNYLSRKEYKKREFFFKKNKEKNKVLAQKKKELVIVNTEKKKKLIKIDKIRFLKKNNLTKGKKGSFKKINFLEKN